MTSSPRYKLRVEIPTDTAEREQKPSLAWIMPSREEEKPTLRRISHYSLTLIMWHDIKLLNLFNLLIYRLFILAAKYELARHYSQR